MLCWWLLLKEFHPTFLYKKSSANVLADALSCMPTSHMERKTASSVQNVRLVECLSFYPPYVKFPTRFDQVVPANGPTPNVDAKVVQNGLDQAFMAIGRTTLIDLVGHVVQQHCANQVVYHKAFLEHLIFKQQGQLPFQYPTLYSYQQSNANLLQLLAEKSDHYSMETMDSYALLCSKYGQHRQICLTHQLLPMAVIWFHEATAHNVGISCLENHLHFHIYHPQMSAEIHHQISQCDTHQYGLLSTQDATTPPWHEVASDCIGPWVIELCCGHDYSI